METTFRTAFERPRAAVQSPAEGPDKWALLDRLTIAADDFELSHRTLTVLKALLSFLPSRQIPSGPAGVVFASNARLSDRLHGMPESTLRRHLARLVKIGLIARQDSPNRKRFARSQQGNIALAFGFDLAPLVVQAAVIDDAAREAEERQQRILAQRDRILVLRHALIRQDGPSALTDEAGRVLRRKPCADLLSTLEAQLRSALQVTEQEIETPTPRLSAAKLSGSDVQNERHIQDSDKSYFDSEERTPAPRREEQPADKPDASPLTADSGITLSEVLTACKELRSYFPERPRNWADVVELADRIAPMLGIDLPVLHEAKRQIGLESAAVTVLCLLERAAAIRSPGAYLRRLTQMARLGRFRLEPMLAALNNRQIVS